MKFQILRSRDDIKNQIAIQLPPALRLQMLGNFNSMAAGSGRTLKELRTSMIVHLASE